MKAYEVEVLQTETCSVCVLSFEEWGDPEGVLGTFGNVCVCVVEGETDRNLSLLGWHLLRASSLGHWMALLISGFLLFKGDLTLTPWPLAHRVCACVR